MGILPIGFFSPLPLAMMIPFLALQSLAMGEAFGKSFQYGKRKISSMSNEEFNKLTFQDLMIEQTANMKAVVPELNKQMAQSQIMQEAIFKEMVNLIPTFFDSLFSALKPEHIENPTNTSLASPPPPITEIRYYNDRDGIPEDTPQMEELKKLLEESLKQQGTKESLAEKLRLENLPPPPPPYTTPPEKKIISKKVQAASVDTEYIAWITKLGQLKSAHQSTKRELLDFAQRNKNATPRQQQVNSKRIGQLTNKLRGFSSQIRLMSNDYRHSNNNIRENALRLRQAIASGQWQQ